MLFLKKNPLQLMSKPAWKAVGTAVIAASLAAGCSAPASNPPQQAASAAAQNKTKTVKTVPISKQSIGDPIEQVADVAASAKIDILAKADGDVSEVLKKRGDAVKKGDVLFRIDAASAVSDAKKNRINRDSASSQLSKAKQDAANGIKEQQNAVDKLKQQSADAAKSYNQTRNNYDMGKATKAQVDQAETQMKNVQMDLSAAEERLASAGGDSTSALAAQLASAQLALEDAERGIANYEIKAPTNGVLTDFDVIAGMTVARGTKLGTVQQMNPITIEAALTDKAARLVKEKKELQFYVSGTTERRAAAVSYLSDVAGAQNRAYTLQLTVDNGDGKLKPGMKVQLELEGKSDQLVLGIPTTSIIREGSDNFVFIYNEGQVEKRKVVLGRLNGTIQEVLEGVKEGESLVVSGQNQLQDKEKAELANGGK